MLTRLLQFSLSQRLFMLLLVAAVAAGGWLAFTKLPIDAFPEVSPVQVKIVFKAPGMTPEEVETRISDDPFRNPRTICSKSALMYPPEVFMLTWPMAFWMIRISTFASAIE